MKITKTASGKTEVRISKQEWINLGKQAGWTTSQHERIVSFRDQLIQLADKMKATLDLPDEDSPNQQTVIVTAPQGYNWIANNDHFIDAWKMPGSTIDINEVYADVLRMMSRGLDDCPPDCECQYDQYEDNMSDSEADADALKNIGWGTDEDYGSPADMI